MWNRVSALHGGGAESVDVSAFSSCCRHRGRCHRCRCPSASSSSASSSHWLAVRLGIFAIDRLPHHGVVIVFAVVVVVVDLEATPIVAERADPPIDTLIGVTSPKRQLRPLCRRPVKQPCAVADREPTCSGCVLPDGPLFLS